MFYIDVFGEKISNCTKLLDEEINCTSFSSNAPSILCFFLSERHWQGDAGEKNFYQTTPKHPPEFHPDAVFLLAGISMRQPRRSYGISMYPPLPSIPPPPQPGVLTPHILLPPR